MRGLIFVAVWMFAIATTIAEEKPSAYEIKSVKRIETDRDDKVKVIVEKDSVVFDLHDIRGIGGVSITSKDGKWPKAVVLKLNLGGLEHFEASTGGKISLKVSVLSHSGNMKLVSTHEGGKEKSIAKGDPYWAEIRMMDAKGQELKSLPDRGKGGYFEVTLPAALFEGDKKTLTLQWIDFYRR